MQYQFSKTITVNNKIIELNAKFKLPIGWIAYIQNKRILIPTDKCHVSPSFNDDEEDDNTCWTKNSVFNFLEKKIHELEL